MYRLISFSRYLWRSLFRESKTLCAFYTERYIDWSLSESDIQIIILKRCEQNKVYSSANVVIFLGGKFREKCCYDISHGGNFHDTTPFSFKKGMWLLFLLGDNFRKEDKSAKNSKSTPTRKCPRLQYYDMSQEDSGSIRTSSWPGWRRGSPPTRPVPNYRRLETLAPIWNIQDQYSENFHYKSCPFLNVHIKNLMVEIWINECKSLYFYTNKKPLKTVYPDCQANSKTFKNAKVLTKYLT